MWFNKKIYRKKFIFCSYIERPINRHFHNTYFAFEFNKHKIIKLFKETLLCAYEISRIYLSRSIIFQKLNHLYMLMISTHN